MLGRLLPMSSCWGDCCPCPLVGETVALVLGFWSNIKVWAVSQHTETSKNIKVWAVSQHTVTSKNIKVWAVSQHTDTSKNATVWAVTQHTDTRQEHQGYIEMLRAA